MFKDYVNLFSSFDVCLLPNHYVEKKKGPIFDFESSLRGKFDGENPTIKLAMNVTEKRNVYLQCLLDCGIAAAKQEQVKIRNDRILQRGHRIFYKFNNHFSLL